MVANKLWAYRHCVYVLLVNGARKRDAPGFPGRLAHVRDIGLLEMSSALDLSLRDKIEDRCSDVNVFANLQMIDIGHDAVVWRGDHSVGQIRLRSVQLCLGPLYRRVLID
jgi:hypothetical protein